MLLKVIFNFFQFKFTLLTVFIVIRSIYAPGNQKLATQVTAQQTLHPGLHLCHR